MEVSVYAAGFHRVCTLGDDYTAGVLCDHHLLPEAYAAQRALQGEHGQLPTAHGALWSKCDPPLSSFPFSLHCWTVQTCRWKYLAPRYLGDQGYVRTTIRFVRKRLGLADFCDRICYR